MIAKTILPILLLCSQACWAQLFVGNGGEGWRLKNGKLVVRDLAENGLTGDYFGYQIDKLIEEKVEFLQLLGGSASFDTKLLARKLTDLNELYPDLGRYVLMAITSYSWSFTDEPLKAVPSDDPVIEGAQKVQIAIRFQNHIRVQRALWHELDSANRIALMIHEGIFSLVLPECRTVESCLQPAYKAREIVAQSFFPPGLRVRNTREVVAQATGLPFQTEACEFQNAYALLKPSTLKLEGHYLHKILRTKPIADFCVTVQMAIDPVEIQMHRDAVWISREFYPASPSSSQLWIKAQRLARAGVVRLNEMTSENCEDRIHRILQRWFFTDLFPVSTDGERCDNVRQIPERAFQ